MAIFKRRGIKVEDVYLILSACVFPVFVWSFINLFNNIPSFILQFNFSEIIGIAAYIFTFAQVESLLYFLAIFSILFLAALVLPKRLLGEHLAAIGSLLATLIAAIVICIQLEYKTITSLSTRRSLFYLGLIGLGSLIYYTLILRFPKFENAIQSILKRFSVLSAIYASFGILGILIIIIRNI